MENPGYIALSRMIVQQHALDVRATNIANTNTPGFKAESVQFSDFLVPQTGTAQPLGGRTVQMVQDRATYRDFSQGQLTKTGNPLDLSLQGDGFFVVQTTRGERYTRAGRFSLSPAGQIVDMSGNTVTGIDSQPITIPPGASGLSVGADGSISTDQGDIGKLKVVKFDELQSLSAEGNSLFNTTQTARADDAPQIAQGVVEGANLQPVAELTKMMSEMREFEFAAQFVDGEGQREQTAIDRIGHKS
jgi:flagellar basal-body rod protein FlgF